MSTDEESFITVLDGLGRHGWYNLAKKYQKIDEKLKPQIRAIVTKRLKLAEKYGVGSTGEMVEQIISDAVQGIIFEPDNDKQIIEWNRQNSSK